MDPRTARFSPENGFGILDCLGDVNVAYLRADNLAAVGFNHSLNAHGRFNVRDHDSSAILPHGIGRKRGQPSVKVNEAASLINEGYAVAVAVKGYSDISFQGFDHSR
jgi:hypothetical protein